MLKSTIVLYLHIEAGCLQADLALLRLIFKLLKGTLEYALSHLRLSQIHTNFSNPCQMLVQSIWNSFLYLFDGILLTFLGLQLLFFGIPLLLIKLIYRVKNV